MNHQGSNAVVTTFLSMCLVSTILVEPYGLLITSVSSSECLREYIGNQRVQTSPRESGELLIPLVAEWRFCHIAVTDIRSLTICSTVLRMPMELQVITLEVVGSNPTGSTVSNASFELNRGRSSIRESALFHQFLS